MSETANASPAQEPGDTVTLTLRRPEALVAFELIARLLEGPESEALRETFEHPADLPALWALLTAFEEELSEPSAEHFRAALESARVEVVAHITEEG